MTSASPAAPAGSSASAPESTAAPAVAASSAVSGPPTSPPAAPGSPVLADLSPGVRRLVQIAFWGNLLCQMGIIVTGGVVRLTGSGLGCSTWPNCEPGQFTPQYTPAMGIHPFIEFGNRTLTGVLTVFALAVLLVTLRWLRGKGRGFVALSVWPLVLTLVQAVLGGITVWMDLHPGVVGPHFLGSVALIAISVVLLVRLYDGDERRRRAVPRALVPLLWALAAVAAVVLLLGTVVTGSGPHSGDAENPVRLPLDPRMMSWLHADAVMLFCGLLIGVLVAVHLVVAPVAARRAARILLLVTVLQAILGYTQYFTDLPELLVGLHLAGAALFTATVTWVVATGWTWNRATDLDPAVRDAADPAALPAGAPDETDAR
ncbi:COX15/CtaA family protein [Brachybacterium sp. EF45031]|uniref:COX15/CtaA family protein n=1 Tax=Brachybacterium sillae TaxID=2810536 RepID=UPI00217EEFD1|nr:COX15/CtaA family protein [Brachybacterium sillae]MCS6710526.1 COX15/CtaA family protein [Brachybacterium sillae]